MESQFFKLAAKRRSTRRFTGEPISDDDVNQIMKTALLAPSSWGKKPVEFVVIKDKQKIKEIARCKAMGAGPLTSAEVAIVSVFIIIIQQPSKTIWIYTGYTYEKLASGECKHTDVTDEILDSIDVLVDGRFVSELKSLQLKFRGFLI